MTKLKWNVWSVSESVIEQDFGDSEPSADLPESRDVRIRAHYKDGALLCVELGEKPGDTSNPCAPQNGYCQVGENQLAVLVSRLADILDR